MRYDFVIIFRHGVSDKTYVINDIFETTNNILMLTRATKQNTFIASSGLVDMIFEKSGDIVKTLDKKIINDDFKRANKEIRVECENMNFELIVICKHQTRSDNAIDYTITCVDKLLGTGTFSAVVPL
ncbi:uncharacterized protein EV154DRAFT_484724 [Mucor mucedo]|uniref:uncharacterized protein n=1 Tax=Mucor mucedo TaxID=29922 RepID=UPI00221F0FEB|nr:uncharacterized protein EV154DRAFT_484724 [Mucor mucedo]KAI7887820.1 hypothetical protein EV154DRAFT_484724 [Mucor mucedo]